MRNILLLAAFVFTASFASAQKCTSAQKAACAKSGKVCSKTAKTCSKTASAATATTDAVVMESEASGSNVLSASAIAELAALAADSDESIQRKECKYSGKVSYYQKSECAKSGKISMNEVKYCTDSQAFVNASPSEVMSAEGEAKVIKTAETVDGKVQSTTGKKKKACCAGKKKCSSKKGA